MSDKPMFTRQRSDFGSDLIVFRAYDDGVMSVCAFRDDTLLISFDDGASRFARHLTKEAARAIAAELVAAADAIEAQP